MPPVAPADRPDTRAVVELRINETLTIAARQQGAAGLVNPQAHWRQRPIEEYSKMLAWLRRWHLPYHVGMSAGEASDLLSFEQLRRLDPVGRGRG